MAGRTHRVRPDIQGLRAVSVVLVVLYHSRVAAFSGGYVGVDVFFVISGYLITERLLDELRRTGTASLRGFYAGRARRILPAAMLVAVVTVVASVAILPPLRARRVAGDAVAAGTYVINYRLASRQTNYFTASAPPSPLQHYWSLAIEEQFYILWPVVLIGASRMRRRARSDGSDRSGGSDGSGTSDGSAGYGVAAVVVVVFAASLVTSVLVTRHDAPWAYFSLASRAWELAAGGLLALVGLRRGRRAPPAAAARAHRWGHAAAGWGGLAAIGVAAVSFTDATAFPGYAALLPVAGAALVVWSGIAGVGIAPLGWRPLRRVGDLSYSWYLWHFPALVLIPVIVGHDLSVTEALALSVVTLGVAAASFVLLENPIRYARPLIRHPLGSIAAGLATSLAAVIAGIVALAALPSFASAAGATTANASLGVHDAGRLAAEITAAASTRSLPADLSPSLAASANDLPAVYRDGCNVSYAGTSSPACTYGDIHSGTTVVLMGDSHAAQWFPAMEAVSTAEHWRLLSLTKLACPAVDVPMFNTTLKRPYVECAQWLRATEARVIAARPALVVVASMRSYTDTTLAPSKAAFDRQWGEGTVRVLEALRASGAPVVMLQDIPLPAGDVPDCLSAHRTDVEACAIDPAHATNQPARRAGEPAWAAQAGVARVDPTPWFCQRRCPPIVGTVLVYRDDSHMTPEYAAWIAPVLLAALRSAAPGLAPGTAAPAPGGP